MSSGSGTPILAGALPVEDARGSGPDPLPGRCSPTAPGALPRPVSPPPSPAPPRPRHRQKLRGSGARPPGRSMLPPTAAVRTALKGAAPWAWDPRGPLAPDWGWAGRVTSALHPQGADLGSLIWGPEPESTRRYCQPSISRTPAGWQLVAWQALEQESGGGPGPGQRCGQLPELRPWLSPAGWEQMGCSLPCRPLRCKAGGANHSPGPWGQMGMT